MAVVLQEVKNYLGISGNTNDDNIQDIINSVEAEVKSFLGVHSLTETFRTDTLDGTGTVAIFLQKAPVNSIDTIQHLINSAWTALTYSAVRFTEQGKVVLEGGEFPLGWQNIKVTYKTGYQVLPYDIKMAIKKLCKIEFDEAPFGDNRLGVMNRNKSNSSALEVTNLDKEARNKILKGISKYRYLNV